MARTHDTAPIVDTYGNPVGNAKVEAYDVTDDSLQETQYTNSSGVASFVALHDTNDSDLKIMWGLFNVQWRRHIFETGGEGGTPSSDHGALTGLTHDDHTQYIKHSLATAANDFLVASGAGVFIKKTLAQTLTVLGKAAASGLASLNASTKVVEQPASISDHLDDTAGGTDAETTKAPTTNVMYDHAHDADAHGEPTVATDSGTATADDQAFSIVGGEGIDTSGATTVVTIAAEDASTTNKGVVMLDTTPADEETKAPTSKWAYDHNADNTAHNALVWAIVFGG